jgi:AsmA protein
MKKPLIIVGIVIVVLIVIVLALPLFFNANQFKPALESDLSAALGRKVEIGNIKLAVFSGGVTIDSLSIADDPAFSPSPFLQAKQLTAGVALIPLIFSKQLQVSSFTVTDPQVSLLRTPGGKWNYSSLGGSHSASKSASPSSPGNFSVGSLEISNGTIVVGTVAPGAKTQTYQDVNLTASDLSYTSQFPFTLTAKTPGGGSVKVEGRAGPVDPTDTSLTPLSAQIDVGSLDLASTGFVDASSGLAGVIDFSASLTSDGHQMMSKGALKATKVRLVAGGSQANVPVNIDYDTTYDLKKQTGNLTRGSVHVGNALSNLAGTYDTSGTEAKVQMKLSGQNMPVPDLEGVLPAAGITLPSGASLQTGTLTLSLAINGPVDKLVITGPVNLSNAKLAGFNLKQKLGALSSLTGLGGSGSGSDTDIQTLSANLHVDPSGTQATNLNIVVPSIGTITGSGTVSSGGQLNCKMVAKLAAGNPMGAVTSALSSFTGSSSQSGGGLPFKIQGTTSHPIFLPDVGAMAKGLAGTGSSAGGSAANAGKSILGGLFGKKKSQ